MPPPAKTAKVLRRWIAAILAGVVLLTQLATAAYACPGIAAEMPARDEAMAGTPCEQMMAGSVAVDPDQPGLCFEHCQADAGQQPPDLGQASDAFAPALVLLFPLAPAGVVDSFAPAWTAHQRQRARAPPAPHSVLHCCYRI